MLARLHFLRVMCDGNEFSQFVSNYCKYILIHIAKSQL